MYKLLKQILKELQAIRRCLEPKNVIIKTDGKDFIQIPTEEINFTRKDFLGTMKPYKFIAETAKDQEQEEYLLQLVCKNANAVGIRNFRKMYKCYCQSVSKSVLPK